MSWTILVIDDDEKLNRLLKKHLGKQSLRHPNDGHADSQEPVIVSGPTNQMQPPCHQDDGDKRQVLGQHSERVNEQHWIRDTKDQREAGRTFVSRTRLQTPESGRQITVLRVVLANPLTTDDHLKSVLDEQCTIILQQDIQELLQYVELLCAGINQPPTSACA